MKGQLIMKSILVIAIALLFITKTQSQNLVLNPGFESFITCPGFGQFSNTYISNWNKPTIASSDYYHYNCSGIHPTVQAPRSGEAYAGIIAYNFGTEYREYVTGTLSSPLVAGQTYNVEFYVSLNDGYIQAISELGAFLSASAPGPFSNALHINVLPQIENTAGSITDTSVWKKISGQFVAAGGEQYITIGNFHNDTTTPITPPGSTGSYGAYYFIEDVLVELDSTTSLLEHLQYGNINYYWTPDNNLVVNISEKSNPVWPVTISVMDINGKNLEVRKIISGNVKFDFSTKQSGIYILSFYEISSKKIVKKLVFTKN